LGDPQRSGGTHAHSFLPLTTNLTPPRELHQV
jgi:hypothetical protein